MVIIFPVNNWMKFSHIKINISLAFKIRNYIAKNIRTDKVTTIRIISYISKNSVRTLWRISSQINADFMLICLFFHKIISNISSSLVPSPWLIIKGTLIWTKFINKLKINISSWCLPAQCSVMAWSLYSCIESTKWPHTDHKGCFDNNIAHHYCQASQARVFAKVLKLNTNYD